VKAFVSQNGRLARSLLRFTHIHMAVTDQIATVPAPEADAATVSTWLSFRRQSDTFATSAASALKHFNFKRFFNQNDRSGKAEAAGRETVSSFGFQVCAVRGVYL
jgi:antirestriction protein ArdC